MSAAKRDLYAILEEEVRTPLERILLDAFLPPAASIPSVFAAPPSPAAEAPPAGASLSQILGRAAPGEEPEREAPKAKRRPARKKDERQKSIEEEIAEFMSRGDHSGLAPDKDPVD